MNYEKLSDEEAIDILKQDFGAAEVEAWQNRNHIISAPDVLYYADAYGDLADAILLQGWDKTLPSRVHKGLLDSGLDVFEAVDTHDLETQQCPSCDADMWQFEIRTGNGHTNREWVSEWGDTVGEMIHFVSNKDSRIWNANPTDDHAPVLCPGCSHDIHRDFSQRPDRSGSVRVHYGETGEVSGFAVSGNLVRFDFDAFYDDNLTDLHQLPGGEDDLPKALAGGSITDWLDEHGWTEIAEDHVEDAANPPLRAYKVGRKYRELAEEWAKADESHPDLDFTYVIDFSTFGKPSFFVAEENKDELMNEITDLIERRV